MATQFREHVDKLVGTDTPRDVLDMLLTYSNDGRRKVREKKERNRHWFLVLTAVAASAGPVLAGLLVALLKSPVGLLPIVATVALILVAQRFRRAADKLEGAEQDIDGACKDLRAAAFKLPVTPEAKIIIKQMGEDVAEITERYRVDAGMPTRPEQEALPDEDAARTLDAERKKK